LLRKCEGSGNYDSPLLVHDAVTTFSATNGFASSDLIPRPTIYHDHASTTRRDGNPRYLCTHLHRCIPCRVGNADQRRSHTTVASAAPGVVPDCSWCLSRAFRIRVRETEQVRCDPLKPTKNWVAEAEGVKERKSPKAVSGSSATYPCREGFLPDDNVGGHEEMRHKLD
jgi:hypothetical protein